MAPRTTIFHHRSAQMMDGYGIRATKTLLKRRKIGFSLEQVKDEKIVAFQLKFHISMRGQTWYSSCSKLLLATADLGCRRPFITAKVFG